eukprot:3369543-Prymnesium_polylepis.2
MERSSEISETWARTRLSRLSRSSSRSASRGSGRARPPRPRPARTAAHRLKKSRNLDSHLSKS